MFTRDFYPHPHPHPRPLDILIRRVFFGPFFKEGAAEQFFFISGGGESGNLKIQFLNQGPAFKKEGPDPNKGCYQQEVKI